MDEQKIKDSKILIIAITFFSFASGLLLNESYHAIYNNQFYAFIILLSLTLVFIFYGYTLYKGFIKEVSQVV